MINASPAPNQTSRLFPVYIVLASYIHTHIFTRPNLSVHSPFAALVRGGLFSAPDRDGMGCIMQMGGWVGWIMMDVRCVALSI